MQTLVRSINYAEEEKCRRYLKRWYCSHHGAFLGIGYGWWHAEDIDECLTPIERLEDPDKLNLIQKDLIDGERIGLCNISLRLICCLRQWMIIIDSWRIRLFNWRTNKHSVSTTRQTIVAPPPTFRAKVVSRGLNCPHVRHQNQNYQVIWLTRYWLSKQ